jgi:hypothetical protein
VYGGTTIILRDMLGNRQLALAGAVNGRLDEAEVLVDFVSRANRFTYGTGYQQQPIFFLADASQRGTDIEGQFIETTALARYIIREGYFNGAYPFNRFSRVEVGTSLLSVERAYQYLSRGVDFLTGYSTGFYVDSIVDRQTLTYARPYVAYVSDNALFGSTGPIYGKRMRLQMGPTFGGARWMQYSADYRRYDPILFNFLTIATRVSADLSYGPDELEFPKYIGRPYYVRGYDREQGSSSDCVASITSASVCSQTQLLGSRVAFGNAELRFPILRRADFGLLPISFPPIEGLFFYDVGAAWSREQDLSLRKPANYDFTRQRYFLSSHGFGVRMNLFNIAIVRWDYSIPHDGANKKGYWVWTLGPSY